MKHSLLLSEQVEVGVLLVTAFGGCVSIPQPLSNQSRWLASPQHYCIF